MRAVLLLSLLFFRVAAAAEGTGDTLVATYRVTFPGAPASDWRFTRSADCVTAERAGGALVERWQRLKNGDVRYLRVFPARRHVIEYRPADVVADWTVVGSVVDARALERLHRSETAREVLGRRATVFDAASAGAATEVWWLADAQLPARIVRTPSGGAGASLTLLSIDHAASQSRPCDGDLSGYAWLDFADAGDRHDDPVVREFLGYSESWNRVRAALRADDQRGRDTRSPSR
jgi:hypothetical protein